MRVIFTPQFYLYLLRYLSYYYFYGQYQCADAFRRYRVTIHNILHEILDFSNIMPLL